MKSFIMTIAISGAGKSYWAEHQEGDYIILDSDKIRGVLFGDEASQENNQLVFKTMKEKTIEALSAGQSCIYCACNLSSKRRANLVSELRRKFPDIHYKCVVLNCSIETCLKRNGARERQVPRSAIIRQISQFQIPLYGEGWDEIQIINTENFTEEYIEELTNQIFDKVNKLTDQNNPHHTLSLWEHLCSTIDNIYNIANDNIHYHELSLAALHHDIGKPFTQTTDEFGVSHYYNHQNWSSYLAMNIGLPLLVLQLVGYHMEPYNSMGIPTWKKRFGDELFSLIMLLHDADERAH